MTKSGATGVWFIFLTLISIVTVYSCASDETQKSQNGDGDTPEYSPGDLDTSGNGGDDDAEAESSELVIVDGDDAENTGENPETESDDTEYTEAESESAEIPDGDIIENEPEEDWDYSELPNPYVAGEYQIGVSAIETEQSGAALQFDLYAPTAIQTYPLIVFQHGFTMDASYYSDMLTHLASHGFVVVAPQMYKASSLIGLPKTAEEAASAAEFYAWLPEHLESFAGVDVDFEKVGLAGHSRGGKVIWLALDADRSLASAVAGVDPVDGTGGPFGGEARVIDGPFDFPFPTLVLGSGLGGSCAPEGDNHVQFYEASAAPAWHVVVSDYGHNDFLNDSTPGCLGCGICTNGPNRASMRRVTAGMLVAFFKHTLTDEPDWDILLQTSQAAPVNVTIEWK